MSNNQILKLRRSAVPGKVPSTSSLDFGELALNTHDGYVFIKKSGSNGEEIVVVGAGSSGSFSGSFFGTSSWAINSVSASYLSGSIGIVNTFTSSGNINVNSLQLGRSSVFPPHFKNSNIVIGSGSMVNIVSASLNSSGSENIAIGDEILTGPTVAHNNVAIGYKALHRFTGSNGTAVGAYALSSSYGGRNTAFGQSAGIYLTQGAFNTIIGDASMFYTIDGNSNTTVGYGSLANFVSGSHNTAIGTIALRELQTGSFNTVIGSNSGRGLISGSYNTVLGILATLEPYASNNIILADGAGNIRARYSSSIWTLADSTVGNFTGSLQGTASWAENSLTASFAPSYLPLTGGTINGNVIVNGTASISFLNVLYETASVIYSSGSNQFGDASDDVQTLYGTVVIPTGSLVVSGSILSTNGLSGSLYGTSSWSVSASYAKSSSNSAFASTASNILGGAATYIPFFNTNTTLGPSTMFQVSNSFSTTSIAINEVNITSDNPEALYVFQTHPTSINVLTGKGNLNSYLQNNIQNTNQGISASSDVVATANNGNESTNYIDMGINSENYNAGFVGGANDAYLYSIANNLHIGNANDNGTHVGFFVGGTDVEANNKLQLNPDNQHKMSGSLDVSGSLNVNAGVTASLYGTASWAEDSISSSYALTASHALNVPETASYAISASIADIAITASYILNAESSSYALTASYAGNVPETASYSLQALSSSYALTASYANNVPATASYALNAISSSYALSASISQIAISASQAQNSVSSSYPVRISGSTLFTPISPDNVNFSTVSNIFMGPGAGAHASGSHNSVFLGYYTGASASAASFSSFIGYNAGYGATSAVSSVFLGESAGQLASLGSYSVMVGALAGSQATNSLLVTFIGYGAGRQASNANNAVFLGREAGSFATEGVGTIAIGTRAGYQNYSASYSIMIGYKAGIRAVTNPNSLGRNNIIIGNSITLDNNRQDSINIGGIIFGTGSYFDTALFNPAFSGSANGRIGINQPFPIFSLDVSGSGRYNNGLEVTGSLIAPNITGSLLGTASWANNALNSVTSSYILNAVSASQAQNAVSSSYPLRVTGSSIYSFDTDQVANVWTIAIGRLTGFQTTAAPFSTFLGVQAGFQAVSASRSVFIGDSSGYQSTNANSSFFAGSAAGGESPNANNSVFIGTSAGYKALNASGSVFLGYNAGEQAVNSAFSNIIGYNAGEFSQSSSFSTLIGYNVGSRVGANSGILSNNIIIGTNITLAAGRQDSINLGGLIFGTGSYSNINTNPFSGSVNGRVGINQPLPLFSLDVSGSGRYSNGLEVTGSLIVKDFLKVDGLLSGSLIPSGSELYDLGSDTNRFRSLYLAGTTIHLGNIKLEETNGTLIIVADSGSGVTETSFSGSFTGSFNGTSSWANNAISASQSQNTVSSSYALLATTASHALVALQAISASYATTASVSISSSYALQATTSSYSLDSDKLDGKDSTTFATTASNIFVGNQIVTGSLSTSGSNSLLGNTTLSGSIIISGSLGTNNPTVKIYGDTTHNGYIRFDPVLTNIDSSISASYIYVSGSTNDLYFSQNGNGYNNTTRLRWLEGNLYTGLLNGGLITIVTGSTTFNLSSGSGIVVNLNASLTDNPYPTIKYVNWSNFTNVPLTYLTSSIQSYIGIDDNGQITQQNTPFTDGEYNTKILIGSVLHQNKSTVNASITYPNVAYGYKQRTYDFIKAFGPLKLSGYNLNTSSSLGLTVGSGTAFAEGRNYQVDPNNPSYIIDPGTSVSKIFRYYQSGSEFVQDTNGGLGYTVIDPLNYNPAGSGSLTPVPGTGTNRQWSIQRVFWYPNSATKGIVVYYGNQTYANEIDAAANISYEQFIEVENTKQNAIYLGALLLRNNATFTDSTSYRILPGGIFRNVGGSGGGGNITSLLLSQLGDVTISGPTSGQALVYNSAVSKWQNTSYISASISGNAVTATTAQTASYVLNAVSSSYALSASQAQNSVSSSYALNSTSASQAQNAVSSSIATTSSLALRNILTASAAGSTITFTKGDNTTFNVTLTTATAETASYIASSNVDGPLGKNSVLSASYAISASQAQNAVTASYILNAVSASYALSASQAQNSTTASYVLNAISSSYSLSSSYALNSTSASFATQASTASYVLNAISSSYALSSSQSQNTISSSFATRAITASYADNLTVAGTLTAQTLVVQTVTSSIDFVTGSSRFGTLLANTHQFTGSVSMTGSLTVVGAGITGSLFGTSSWANNAISASQSLTASYILNAISSSYALSASQAQNSVTASYILNAVSSSYALSASQAQNAVTSSYILNAVSSSYALSSSQAQNAVTASYVLNAVSSSFATSASQAQNAVTASYVLNAVSASFATTASNVLGGAANYIPLWNGATTLSSSVMYQSSGNVGIGTTSPTASLHVYKGLAGTTTADRTTPLDVLVIESENTAQTEYDGFGQSIVFRGSTYNDSTQRTLGKIIHQIRDDSVNTTRGSSLNIQLATGSTGNTLTSRLYIDYNGNVGIGTTSPYNYSTWNFTTLNGNGGSGIVFRNNNVDTTQLYGFPGGTDLLSTGYFQLYTGGSVRMFVASTGNVGIGTTSPSQKLEVSGNIKLTSGGYLYGDGSSAYLQLTNANGSRLAYGSSVYLEALAASINVRATSEQIDIFNNSGRVYLSGAGNVGIGTNSPNAKLDVNGNTIITGSLTATTTFTLDATLTDYATVASSVVGSNNLFNQATGSYTSAFFKYTVTSGSSTRAGEVVAAWNGTSVQFYDNSTVDIGSTTAVTSSVSIVTGNVQFNVQTNTSGWRIKSLATFI